MTEGDGHRFLVSEWMKARSELLWEVIRPRRVPATPRHMPEYLLTEPPSRTVYKVAPGCSEERCSSHPFYIRRCGMHRVCAPIQLLLLLKEIIYQVLYYPYIHTIADETVLGFR